jgi:hypothetical protein
MIILYFFEKIHFFFEQFDQRIWWHTCLIFHYDASLMISFFITKTFQFGHYSKFGLISVKPYLIQLIIEICSYIWSLWLTLIN